MVAMSWDKFIEQLFKTLFKMAVISWLYIYEGRVVALLLNLHSNKSYCIAFILSFSFTALMMLWYIKKGGGRYALTLDGIYWQLCMWTLLLCIAQYMFIAVLRGKIPVLIAEDKITTGFITYLFQVVLCAPIVEEIVFRGFFQKQLLIKLSPRLAILITSILFALAHYEIISNILPAFLSGIFCGIIYYKTDKLILCILYHAFFNLLGSVLPFSLKYDLILRMATLIIVIGLAVYSIREFMKNTSLKNHIS